MLLQIKNLCIAAALLAAISLASAPARAQKNDPPFGKFGIGVYAITSNTIPSGLEGTYAINPNVQVGSLFSVQANSGSSSYTRIFLGPFFRYLFSSTVSPFIQGGLQLPIGNGNPSSSLFLGGGVAYYLNQEIGLHADVDLLDVSFSNPSLAQFGWFIVRGGADWFF